MHLHADYSIKMGYIACVYWEYLPDFATKKMLEAL